jgi:hypothetical protein
VAAIFWWIWGKNGRLTISSAWKSRCPLCGAGHAKVSQRGLTNMAIVQADANYALQALIAPDSLSGVYINFPDPWPKRATSSGG